MAQVSLIPLTTPGSPWPTDRLGSFRAALMAAGHLVKIETSAAGVESTDEGLVARVIDQIRQATSPNLIVVDMAMAYTPDDLVAVVDRLGQGSVALVVASRRGRWLGSVSRRLSGVSDPISGLIGLTSAAARVADGMFAPVGSRFTCELLARVAGERAEVIVDPVPAPRRRWVPLDDVRHAKKLADERLGTLSRLVQFCFVGASGMIVDLSMYAALLALLSRTPLHDRSVLRVVGGNSVTLAQALAGFLAISTAIIWNFSLNRRLTFNDARRGSIARQFLRYVLSNLAGCAVSLAFRLFLPSRIPFFARHRLAAAVTGIVAATGISFSLARWFVFSNRPNRESQHRHSPATSSGLDPVPDRDLDLTTPPRPEPVAWSPLPAQGSKPAQMSAGFRK